MNHVQSHSAPQSHPQEYRSSHDPNETANLSTSVVHAIADAKGEDVSNPSFVLHDSIDPDALDRLFAHWDADEHRTAGHISFSIDGYQVTVHGTGEIVITPPDPQPSQQTGPPGR